MSGFNGKGSGVRPTHVTKEEKALRLELLWDKPSEKRKKEIYKRLDELVNTFIEEHRTFHNLD